MELAATFPAEPDPAAWMDRVPTLKPEGRWRLIGSKHLHARTVTGQELSPTRGLEGQLSRRDAVSGEAVGGEGDLAGGFGGRDGLGAGGGGLELLADRVAHHFGEHMVGLGSCGRVSRP